MTSLVITAPHSSEARTETSSLPIVYHPGPLCTHGPFMAWLAQKSRETNLWALLLGPGADLLNLPPVGSLLSTEVQISQIWHWRPKSYHHQAQGLLPS